MDKIELLKQAIETGSEVVVVTGRAVPTEIYKNPDGKPFVRMSDGVSYSVDAYQFDVYSVATTIRDYLAKSAEPTLRTTAAERKAMAETEPDEDTPCIFCGDYVAVDDGKDATGYCHQCATDNLPKAFADIDTLLLLNTKKDAMIQDLRETLSQLRDHQNGCPLPKYEKAWTEAMADAERLLKDGET